MTKKKDMIHDSSLRYLVDLANGLETSQDINPLLSKLKTANETGKLDSKTVDLVEKTLILIQQLQQEQQEELTARIQPLTDRTVAQLLYTFDSKLKPLLHQTLAIKTRDVFIQRISRALERLNVYPEPQDTGIWNTLTGGFRRFMRAGADVVTTAASAMLSYGSFNFDQEAVRLRENLIEKTKSSAGAEFSRVTAEKICDFLKEEVVDVDAHDPIVRPNFLVGDIFTQETALTTAPEHTALGRLLANLLTNSPKELEKIIEVNLLQATTNIVDTIDNLQKNKPYFLVDLCFTCLHDVMQELDGKKVTTEDEQRMLLQQFVAKGTDVIFGLAFPGGAKDLILPGFVGVTDLVVRDKIWTLVRNVVQDQLSDFLNEVQGKEDIKNLLLIEGYSNILPIIGEAPQPVGVMRRAATIIPQGVGTLSLAPAGFVFIFIKIVITSILSVFHAPGLHKNKKKSDYVNQESFNAHLKSLVLSIVENTDSKFLKFIAKHKLDRLVQDWGPAVVEAIRDVQLMDVFNAQCESLIQSVVSPGGQWVGEGDDKKYETVATPMPKTLQEQQQKEEQQAQLDQNRAEEVERLQGEFGKSVSGLVQRITDMYKVTHTDFTETELETATSAEKLAKRIHKAWAAFANACIHQLVRLAAYIINARGMIRTSAAAFHKNIKKVKQDATVHAIGEYAAKELYYIIKA